MDDPEKKKKNVVLISKIDRTSRLVEELKKSGFPFGFKINGFKTTVPKLFADETNIFIFHKTKETLFQIANTELESLENWLLANKLSLSIGINKETRFSFFTPTTTEDKSNLPNLKLLVQNTPRTDYVKYLGILLDDCLTFKSHIKKLRDKLKQYVGVFYLLRHNLPKRCLRTLYFTFIFKNL